MALDSSEDEGDAGGASRSRGDAARARVAYRVFAVGAIIQLAGLAGNVALARLTTLEVYGELRTLWIGASLVSGVAMQSLAVVVLRSSELSDRVHSGAGRQARFLVSAPLGAACGLLGLVLSGGALVESFIFGAIGYLAAESVRLGAFVLSAGKSQTGALVQWSGGSGALAGAVLVAVATDRPSLLLLSLGAGISAVCCYAAAVIYADSLLPPRRLRTARGRGPGISQIWKLICVAVVGLGAMDLGRILVAGLLDPATFAWYTVGASEVPLVAVLTTAIGQALFRDLGSAIRIGNKDEAARVWSAISFRMSRVTTIAGGALFLVAPRLIPSVYGEEFAPATTVLQIHLALLVTRGLPLSPVLLAAGAVRLMTWANVLAALSSATFIVAGLAMFGPLGAAAGTVAGSLATFGFLLWSVCRFMSWDQMKPAVLVAALRALVCGASSIVLAATLVRQDEVVWLPLSLGIYTLVVLANERFLVRRRQQRLSKP